MFKKPLSWIVVLLCLVSSQIKAQQLTNDKIDILAGSSEFLINQVIYKPANFSTSKSYPLVLFFHGMGEAGTDVNKMYSTGLPRVLKDGYVPSFEFIMVAPQHGSYSVDPKHVQQILDETLLRFPNIDQSRIYITGLSAGGLTVYGSAMNVDTNLAKKFAAMVVLSGATQDVNKTHFSWWKSSKIPVWAVVGDNDVSYRDQNQYMVNEINKQVAGLASITIRPGVGHGGWNDVYKGTVKTSDQKNMWEWLYQFTRNSSGSSTSPTPPPPPPPPPPSSGSARFVKVNVFSGSNAYSSTEWNNWNAAASLSSSTFKFSDGTTSSVKAVLSQQSSVTDNGSSYNPTMAPKEVIRYTSYSTSNRTLTISGLDNSKTYDLELYASRSGASTNSTRFTVSGTSIDISTSNNLDEKASYTSLTPVSGQITVSISKLNTYNYLNGFVLTENGSGGGTTNSPPVANAGTDKNITLPASSVQLSGSATDPGGSVASYSWQKTAGPSQFSFSSATAAAPTVSNLVEGTYTFRLTATDNQGATDTDDVTVIVSGATSTPSGSTRFVKVNVFSGSNAYSSTEWNNWNAAASLSSSTFKFSDGTTSSVKAVLSQQSSVTDNGSSYNPTMAPKEVIRYTSYSTSNRTLTISGLDNSKTYDLELYASRSGATVNTTRFGINGNNVDIITGNNLDEKASFTSLTPVSGQITVSISKLNTYNYLNGFVLTEKGSGGSVVVTPPPTPPTNYPSNCNNNAAVVYTLQPSGGEIYIPNASGRGWKGGDTLRIPAGNYSLIDLGNFKGDECRPIVITNYGGQVTVNQIRFGNDAAYFKLSGAGHPAFTYGFKINSSANAGVAVALAHHVEINNIEVTGTEVGMYLKKNPSASDLLTIYPNYVLSNYYIHHNYIHNVRGEGMYIGDTYPSGDPYSGNLVPVRMDQVEIAYNTVDGTDWDGIQLSNARSGAKIHHNTVTNFGRINMGSQQAGIILGGNTTGDIYDNVVKNGTGNGIQAFGYGTIRIYNNTVENAGADGTASGQESVYCNDPVNLVESNPKQQILFYNNTIKNPTPKGAIRVGAYNANSLASSITNNYIQLANAQSNWLSMYVVSHVAGSTITGNTLM